jgi:hypothetical protein
MATVRVVIGEKGSLATFFIEEKRMGGVVAKLAEIAGGMTPEAKEICEEFAVHVTSGVDCWCEPSVVKEATCGRGGREWR